MMNRTLAPARLPPDQRVYAIGDVHGCAGRLADMHRLIRADLAARPNPAPCVIHLGDLVDRGPDSAGVVAMLCRPWPDPADQVTVVNLMGNHEDMMLDAVTSADSGAVRHWLANGGRQTLESWGVPPSAPAARWWDAIPPAHLGFLRGLSLFHRAGGYVFVHAGLRPEVPLARQSREDLLWIREPFLSWAGALPLVAVHGHTPEAEPVVRANRIGIDTGAVMGGKLTCAVLEADTLGFLQT
jgi:serine/threonine protein phosphatase 1